MAVLLTCIATCMLFEFCYYSSCDTVLCSSWTPAVIFSCAVLLILSVNTIMLIRSMKTLVSHSHVLKHLLINIADKFQIFYALNMNFIDFYRALSFSLDYRLVTFLFFFFFRWKNVDCYFRQFPEILFCFF